MSKIILSTLLGMAIFCQPTSAGITVYNPQSGDNEGVVGKINHKKNPITIPTVPITQGTAPNVYAPQTQQHKAFKPTYQKPISIEEPKVSAKATNKYGALYIFLTPFKPFTTTQMVEMSELSEINGLKTRIFTKPITEAENEEIIRMAKSIKSKRKGPSLDQIKGKYSSFRSINDEGNRAAKILKVSKYPSMVYARPNKGKITHYNFPQGLEKLKNDIKQVATRNKYGYK